jgi:putative membrane protein
MKTSRYLLTLATALSISSGAFAQNQSQGQTTPPTTTESNKAQTGTANPQQNPTTDPTDTTSRQQRDRTGSTSATGDKNRASSTSTAGATGDMLTPSDRKFMMTAAEGGMAEVKLAQMAQTKASSQAVKDLAKTIEQDHTKANEELKRIAQMRGVDLPSSPPTTGSHEKTMAKLDRASGEAFDKAYVKEMINHHKKDIKEFERESNIGMDTNLKTFASDTLPTLRNHLQMAQSASGNVKSSGSATSASDSSSTGSSTDTRSRTTSDKSGSQGTQSTTTPPSGTKKQ